MTGVKFTDVTPETLPLLRAALEHLAADLDDPYRADTDRLSAALFGPHPACHAVLALGHRDALLGAALFSPVMSTTTGTTGAYVSDLWVAQAARGQALGPRVLSHVARRAHDLWQAGFIRLVSYESNRRARDFYARLGFSEARDEIVLRITGDAFDQLRNSR